MMHSIVNSIFKPFNIEIKRIKKDKSLPADFEEIHNRIFKKVQPFTMTSAERIFSLIEAVNYIENNKIEGAIVECGVWKGGSMLAIAETLIQAENTNRQLFLYDTFEGMSEPTVDDKAHFGISAAQLLQQNENKEENLIWAYSTLEEVKKTMALSNYNKLNIHFIKGKVEDTIPNTNHSKIALLRLDTDWYESTKHEMIHLFPLLATGGVLILDDYGYWQGARKAVDEYIKENNIQILLNRIDETGRIAIKQ